MIVSYAIDPGSIPGSNTTLEWGMSKPKKRKLPKVIQVLSYQVKITIDKAKMDAARTHEEIPTAYGFCDIPNQEILSDESLAEDTLKGTIFHELNHFVFGVTGANGELGREREEAVIMMTSDVMFDTLKRNPDLVKYLFLTE